MQPESEQPEKSQLPISGVNWLSQKKEIEQSLGQPFAQADRCVNLWLEAKRLRLSRKAKKRLSVLVAAFFGNEDQVSDTLIINFLNVIWETPTLIEPDDMHSRKIQIESIIEQAEPAVSPMWYAGALLAFFLMSLLMVFYSSTLSERLYQSPAIQKAVEKMPITAEQADELKDLVQKIVTAERSKGLSTSANAVWSPIKNLAGVNSYKDLPRGSFNNAKMLLVDRLKKIQ